MQSVAMIQAYTHSHTMHDADADADADDARQKDTAPAVCPRRKWSAPLPSGTWPRSRGRVPPTGTGCAPGPACPSTSMAWRAPHLLRTGCGRGCSSLGCFSCITDQDQFQFNSTKNYKPCGQRRTDSAHAVPHAPHPRGETMIDTSFSQSRRIANTSLCKEIQRRSSRTSNQNAR